MRTDTRVVANVLFEPIALPNRTARGPLSPLSFAARELSRLAGGHRAKPLKVRYAHAASGANHGGRSVVPKQRAPHAEEVRGAERRRERCVPDFSAEHFESSTGSTTTMSPTPAASRGGASRADNKNWGVGKRKSEEEARGKAESEPSSNAARARASAPSLSRLPPLLLQVGRRKRAVLLRVALPSSAATAAAAASGGSWRAHAAAGSPPAVSALGPRRREGAGSEPALFGELSSSSSSSQTMLALLRSPHLRALTAGFNARGRGPRWRGRGKMLRDVTTGGRMIGRETTVTL